MKTIKNRMAQIFALVLSLCLVVSAFGVTDAYAGSMVPRTGEVMVIPVEPGVTNHQTIPVKARDGAFTLHSIAAECSNPLMRVENLKFVDHEGNAVSMTGGYTVYGNSNVSLDFDVVADDSLKIGYNEISFTGVGLDFTNDPFSGQVQIDLLNISTYTSTELEPAVITASDIKTSRALVPGSTSTLTITVRNEGDVRALNTFAVMDYGDSGLIPNYTVSKIRIGELAKGGKTTIDVPVKVLPTAKTGMYKIGVSFSCKNKRGEDLGPFNYDLYVNVVQSGSDASANLEFTTASNYTDVELNTNDNIMLKLANKGEGTASDISITCVSGMDTSTGITRRYTTDFLEVKNLKAGKSADIEVPIAVSENASIGLHELVFKLDYTDSTGMIFSKNLTMYVTVKNDKNAPTGDIYNYISIKNISQSPATPVAGEKVTVSFDIVNEGNADVTNFRLYGANLSSAGFEPISSEPYQTVGSIAKGASQHASMTFFCGNEIPAGTNTMTIGFDYIDAANAKQSGTVSLYVLNVKSASAVGRPKLIVNAFGTDKDILKAGDTFEFSFTLKNTHANKAANNIKITLSQDEGIFSPASGTNIFYIEQINAGEEATQTMTLKTRADATTGDYAVKLLVEYEYDDMSEIDTKEGGVKEENDIKLRATENYRPVISNLYVEAWDTIYVGNPVDLSFEFYNMGKSTLGNVYVTVEGDFVLANNSSMSYVGAVNGYGQEYVNPQVVPQVAGEAIGTLVVHFEDSNGDEVTVSQDFTCFVEDQNGGFDGGMWDDPGMYDDPNFDPGMYDDPDFGGDDMNGAKKGLFGMPRWLTITLAVVVVAGIAVAVFFIVKKAKTKKQNSVKEDDDEDY